MFVEFSSSNLNVSASDDSLTVTLVSSGNTLSESFIIGVIAEADNATESPAAGMYVVYVVKVISRHDNLYIYLYMLSSRDFVYGTVHI